MRTLPPTRTLILSLLSATPFFRMLTKKTKRREEGNAHKHPIAILVDGNECYFFQHFQGLKFVKIFGNCFPIALCLNILNVSLLK